MPLDSKGLTQRSAVGIFTMFDSKLSTPSSYFNCTVASSSMLTLW